LYERAIGQLDRAGWHGTHLGFAHALLAQVRLRQGRLLDAEADAAIALRLADRIGSNTPVHWYTVGTYIQILIARGQLRSAADLAHTHNYGQTDPAAITIPWPRSVYGQLCLALGQTSAAVATLRQVGTWLDAHDITNPSWCPWRLDLAEALADDSTRQEAMTLAEQAHQQAERYGCLSARGRALRTLARLSTNGDSLALLQQSAEILRDCPNRLEYAETKKDLGMALRQAMHFSESVDHLYEALAIADNSGAERLAANIRTNLTQSAQPTPPEPPLHTKLTIDQRRAGRLAASDLTDAEIAHRMVIDLDTATTLVGQARQTLGVPTRSQLHAAFDDL
jgi:tetratricopeptide (TPR) repeat protein